MAGCKTDFLCTLLQQCTGRCCGLKSHWHSLSNFFIYIFLFFSLCFANAWINNKCYCTHCHHHHHIIRPVQSGCSQPHFPGGHGVITERTASSFIAKLYLVWREMDGANEPGPIKTLTCILCSQELLFPHDLAFWGQFSATKKHLCCRCF